MAKAGDRIDPDSIRLTERGRVYWIGMRVMTDRGLGTITGFDPTADHELGVTLDGQTEELYTTWENADPLD